MNTPIHLQYLNRTTMPPPMGTSPRGTRRSACSPAVVHVLGPAVDARELDTGAAGCVEAARPAAEAVVGARRDDTAVGTRDLVVERLEGRVAPAAVPPPRPQRRGQVVLPRELGPDLVEHTVDEDRVLGRSRPVGPLPTHLQADHTPARAPRARAPVPAHVVGPAPAPVVQDGP